MKIAFVVSSLLFAATGCLDSQVSDGVLTARTDDGDELTITAGEHAAQIDWDGQRAVLAWTDTAATITHGGASAVLVSVDDGGAWSPKEPPAAFVGLGLVLSATERSLIDHGVALPWREDAPVAAGAACTTTSTWVWSSYTSCTDCYSAAREESGVLWPDESRSCSVGRWYTTCSVTQCSRQEELESPLEL